MNGTATALCADALASDAPEWVHLFPLGKMTGRDGREFDLASPEAIKADFEARRVNLPVDYEHQSEGAKADQSGPVPAAGWIKALRIDGRGLWGRVEWTATARELIATKAYRYLSPAFNYLPQGNVITRLKGAGLVHHPNLELTALARQEDSMAKDTPKPAAPGDTAFLQRLLAALNLPPETDGETLIAAIEKMMANRDKPDPAKFVPMEVMHELLRDRGLQTATMTEQRATAKVNDAFAKGYLTKPMREWATALCHSDEAAFDQFIASSVPMFGHLTRPSGLGARPPVAREHAMASDAETAICTQLGLKPGTLAS